MIDLCFTLTTDISDTEQEEHTFRLDRVQAGVPEPRLRCSAYVRQTRQSKRHRTWTRHARWVGNDLAGSNLTAPPLPPTLVARALQEARERLRQMAEDLRFVQD